MAILEKSIEDDKFSSDVVKEIEKLKEMIKKDKQTIYSDLKRNQGAVNLRDSVRYYYQKGERKHLY